MSRASASTVIRPRSTNPVVGTVILLPGERTGCESPGDQPEASCEPGAVVGVRSPLLRANGASRAASRHSPPAARYIGS